MRGTNWIANAVRDFRYAIRQLRKSPGFTCSATFVFALICSPATAQQTGAPDTAAGRVFSEWLKSFNSADAATITAFNNNHRRQARPIGQTLNLREQTGGFSLLRVEKSEPLSINVLLQETNSDQIGQLELVVDSEDPPKIVREALLPVSHPPDLAIPRLTEAAALAALSDYAEKAADSARVSAIVLIASRGKVLLAK